MDDFQKMKHALTRVEGGKIKAFADGDKVFLFIQNAPEELRKLADALEALEVSELSALVAYTNAKVRESQRTPIVESEPQ